MCTSAFCGGIPSSSCPFHCWLMIPALLFPPVSLLDTPLTHRLPVSLLARYPGYSPMVRTILHFLDIPARTNAILLNIPGTARTVRHPGNSRMSDTSFTPRNNSSPTGNPPKRSKKPATESSVAQGAPECQTLYFSDQNCKSPLSHLSDTSWPTPGLYRGNRHLSDGNNNPGGAERSTKPGITLKTPL